MPTLIRTFMSISVVPSFVPRFKSPVMSTPSVYLLKRVISCSSSTMLKIFDEYLSLRPYSSNEEYLFVNIFGKKLCKSTHYHQLAEFNKSRGVETTGIHRYRHTFAKQWILSGGNVVTLCTITLSGQMIMS